MRTATRAPARLLALALAAAACAGCPDGDGGSASDGAGEPLVVGYSALRISLPVFVAAERDLFARHGLEVELRRYETAQPLVEEVLDGRVLAGGYAALPIVLTAASQDGSEVRLATAMVEDAEHPVSYLLRRDGDGAIRSAADLEGRRVGILPTVAYRRWLDAILKDAGVAPSDVRVMPLAPPQQTAALAGGGVDALFTNDPMATATLSSGVGERFGPKAPVPDALGGRLLFGSFLVHPRLVEHRPEQVRRLLAALDDAIAFIKREQGAARRHMRPFVREPERPFVARYPDARYRSARAFDDAALRREAQRAARLGAIDRAIATDGWTLARLGREEAR